MSSPPARTGRGTVAFVTSAYLGHFYPTIELARALSDQGWRVLYLPIEQSGELTAAIAREGFAYEDAAPLLDVARLGQLMTTGRVRTARALLRAQIAAFKALTDRANLAAVIVDNFVRFIGGLATFNGVPVVSACYNYVENVSISRTVTPRDFSTSRIRHAPARSRVLRQWIRTPGLLIDRWFGVQRDIARFAAAQRLDTRYFIYNQVRLFTYPAFYFAPKELLPPHERRGTFLGLCVSKRHRRSLDAPQASIGEPIVYVSLGTVGGLFEARRAFLVNVVRAFATRVHLRVVIHLSRHIAPEDIGPVPPHITLAQSLDQLDMIERARLVITHGGLGAIKECIYFATPMLLFPLVTEELENARRVSTLGLGLIGGSIGASPDEIWVQTCRMLPNAQFAERARALKAAIEQDDPLQHGLDTLTQMIGGRT